MRMPAQKQRPRRAQTMGFPAPTGGLVSNRNLAMSNSPDMPPGAAILEDMFPTATGVVLRRGSATQDTLTGGAIGAMFTYTSGTLKEFFSATDDGIWDTTTSTAASVLSGQTSGDWSTVQFTTSGGTFLIGVNGEDDAFLYDGTSFTATSITFPLGETLTTADLIYCWTYKTRIWFIEKNSLNAWYLPVDQIGGELTLWPMGGVFANGGSLLWGQAWSLDSGGSGGLSEQCTFCTTEGEVSAYQGLSPDPDQGWSSVGVYRIGKPMGKKAFIRAGGDIVIATTVGFVSLASASQQDYAALGQGAVSYPIEDDWARAVSERGQEDWRCQVWADGQMALVSPPAGGSSVPIVFASNTNTGKWATFTAWDARSLGVFNNNLYFGTSDGDVVRGWVGGSDDGNAYTGKVMPLFSDLGAPANIKIAKMARAVIRSKYDVNARLSGRADFNQTLPPAPALAADPSGDEWDIGLWDEALWDATSASLIKSQWVPIGAYGDDLTVGLQISSGYAIPSDAELIRIDMTYTLADIVT